MADADDGTYVRLPEIEDVVRICRSLNEAGARYLLIGGFAVIAHGLGRTTKDIDFLVDDAPENVARVKAGLDVLADRAAREIDDGDIRRYTVVRVADEVLVDLLGRACGVTTPRQQRMRKPWSCKGWASRSSASAADPHEGHGETERPCGPPVPGSAAPFVGGRGSRPHVGAAMGIIRLRKRVVAGAMASSTTAPSLSSSGRCRPHRGLASGRCQRGWTRPAGTPQILHRGLKGVAPQVGFEPTTLRLTAGCSAIELLRNGSPDAANNDYRSRADRGSTKGRGARSGG